MLKFAEEASDDGAAPVIQTQNRRLIRQRNQK